jgi:signal transduction histidine kinase
MLAFEIGRTVGWLIGTILHGLLLGVLVEGRRKRGTSYAYIWLVGSALLWHLGNLLAVFLGELTGNRLPSFLKAATILATVGFGLLPSALIHTAVVARKDLFSRPRLTIVLGYLPVGAIAPVVRVMLATSREEFQTLFRHSTAAMVAVGVWFVIALALAARTISTAARTPEREREHLRFRRSFGVGLFSLAAALALAVVVQLVTGGEQGIVTEAFLVSVMIMSLLPGGLFFYHIYHYRYLDLTLRRGLSVAALVLAVFLSHALVIRRIADGLEAKYGVDFTLLEGVLVVAVVLLFEPARRRVQSAIDVALAPDRSRRRSRLAAVQGAVASLPPGDLRPLVARAHEGLEAAFGVRAVVALRISWGVSMESEDDGEEGDEDAGGDRIASAPPIKGAELAPLLDWASGDAASPGRPFSVDVLPPGAANVARKLGLSDLVPIRGEMPAVRQGDNESTCGFIGLGATERRQALGEEDVAMLAGLSHTLAVAARDTDFVRRMVALQQKLAEAERLSSLGRLSATIAHEVKNPLSSIKTIVGVLRESKAGGQGADADLEVIQKEVNRLSSVVTNLLNVARPAKKPGEGTSIAPSPAGFDPREMLEGLLAVLGPDARRRGLRVETAFAPGTPRVWARESAIRQAVFQLILNAIEITRPGGTVTVACANVVDPSTLTADKRPHGEIEIVVEDTGPGIPPDKVDRIFEPFFSMKPGGTGLGLSLARDEVRRAEGRIIAGARLDGQRGARFRVILPAASRLAPT